MQKLTSKFVRKNCYFILYDYPNDDKLICYFDSYTELHKIINYSPRKLCSLFNSHCSDCLPVSIRRFNCKFYLHIFIDEELAVQKS